MVKDMKVNLGKITLSNPVIPASGTFGFGLEMAPVYDLNVLGGISLKGSTENARFGNECPRIAECPAGMLNSVGLQNPGVKALVDEKVPQLRKVYSGCIIANISGFSVEEYMNACKAVSKCPEVDIIELNVSCPNVHGGGMAFGTSVEAASQVTRAVKSVAGDKPVFVKLSPNVSNIADIAKACEYAGADGLVLINTMQGMRIDLQRRRPVLANVYGGYSGPGIFPVALRMVHQVRKVCRIPIIGCGGVSSARDVIEMMMAGASAVEVGSENLRNPMACKEIVEQLPQVMESLGIESLKDIIGIV